MNDDDFLKSYIVAQKEIQRKMIIMLQDELKDAPEGAITRKLVKGKQYLYHSLKDKGEGHSYYQKFLKNSEIELKSKLIRKELVLKALKLLQENVGILDLVTTNYNPVHFAELLHDLPIDFTTLPEHLLAKASKISVWEAQPFEKCNLYPEKRIHMTPNGLLVRSKSEALIAGLLESNKIPYRYEARLELNGQTYYPDFTIMNPKDGEIIYWEHFGMTHQPSYRKSTIRKQDDYLHQGILPWEHYIATYDNNNGSINVMKIQNIIRAFILD
ncbi:MAG: hypothetical protein WCL54_02825 [Clostridia bacterium]